MEGILKKIYENSYKIVGVIVLPYIIIVALGWLF